MDFDSVETPSDCGLFDRLNSHKSGSTNGQIGTAPMPFAWLILDTLHIVSYSLLMLMFPAQTSNI